MQILSRQEVNQHVEQYAFLPLFNVNDLETSKHVLKAAYDGGVRMFECTNRSPEALAIFRELIPYAAATMPDLVIGAGTIMDKDAARNFHEAGAQFIVSPVIRPEVAAYCNKNNLFWCPGASTLNEIIQARDMGADLVKIFPANLLGGPDFVKAIMAPCPDIRVMPTGGVDGSAQNLEAWFEAGVVCVGMGRLLFTTELIASGNYAALTHRIKEITNTIKTIKKDQR